MKIAELELKKKASNNDHTPQKKTESEVEASIYASQMII
jgi:hypothetical protein